MKWFVSQSAVKQYPFNKPPPGPWDGYFYDGPSVHFGHYPAQGSKK